MNKLLLVFIFLFSQISFGNCEFSTGISPMPDGTYRYTKECHIAVGEMKYNLGLTETKLDKLNKALEYKDLALDKADERIERWRNLSLKLEDRLETVDSARKTNEWLYFGLGALTVFMSGYMASQLIH
jgi:hypothetical protein